MNVVVKGTTNGAQTDFDGNYTLNVTNGQELQFSYIGQRTEELPIYSSVMNVSLEEDAQHLDEVVVVGYGISGSTSGVRTRETYPAPRIPEPLVIVDGVPMDGFVEGDLDESEIQHIEVLKGANATSIYGNKGNNGVMVITTKKSSLQDDITNTKFVIKKPYSIASDGDVTAIEINTFKMPASYEYYAAPIINENVFLTASFKDWEQYQLLPGEANIYFKGTYAGKTVLDPYTVKKEMVLSLGIDPNITVTRKQQRNFKSKSFTGSNRILDRIYDLEVKNNKNTAISLKLMDRVPKSQNKDIKVDDVETFNAEYDKKKGLLTWVLDIAPKENKKESFSFKVKYPRGKYISL